MNSLKLGSYATLILACQFVLLGTPGEAAANMTNTVEHLPTTVVGPPRSSEYPQPICSKCKVVADRESTPNGDSWGILSLTYYDEVYSTFQGSIRVTALRYDETVYTLTILDVDLEEDEDMAWTLASGSGLSWLDVEHVWVEMLPAS